MRAYWAMRPLDFLENEPSVVVVMVAGMRKSGWKGYCGYLLVIE